MREKYLGGKFGTCPRVLCEKQNVIPIGISEDVKLARAKVYCPRCKDIYAPKKKFADVDGAYFGTSFPHLLLMVSHTRFRLTLTSSRSLRRSLMCQLCSGSRWKTGRTMNNRKRNWSTKKQRTKSCEQLRARWCQGRKTRRRKDDFIVHNK